MILVHLKTSWPNVLAGEDDADRATLKAWAGINDASLQRYADVVLGIYKDEVVSAYDVTGWERQKGDRNRTRVAFEGNHSKRWGHLIGTPNPGTTWGPGMARPVQYLDTQRLIDGDVEVEDTEAGRRAIIEGFILTVLEDGNANLVMPKDRQLQVIPA